MLRQLPRYKAPPPPPVEICVGCLAMAPDVLVPAETFGREGAPIPMCWVCAHLATEHEIELGGAGLVTTTMCTCKREVIFPDRTWPETESDSDLVERVFAPASCADVAREHDPGPASAPRRSPAREKQMVASERARAGAQARSALTLTTVREIRERAASGESQAALAVCYGVSAPTISNVVRRLTWNDAR